MKKILFKVSVISFIFIFSSETYPFSYSKTPKVEAIESKGKIERVVLEHLIEGSVLFSVQNQVIVNRSYI